jgi:hypothetical protein
LFNRLGRLGINRWQGDTDMHQLTPKTLDKFAQYDRLCQTAVQFIKQAKVGLQVTTVNQSERFLAYVYGVFCKMASDDGFDGKASNLFMYYYIRFQGLSGRDSRKKLSLYQELALRHFPDTQQAATDLTDWFDSDHQSKGYLQAVLNT